MGIGESMKVALSLDDFSVVNNRLDLLLKLKEHFPNFKVSLFTVVTDEKKDWGPSLVRDDFLKEIKKNLDWLQIIPHALTHNGSEVAGMDYQNFKFFIARMRLAFERDELPFVNGFKAPHWRWNEDIVRALDDEGWWGAVDRNKAMPKPKSFYQYNFPLNEPFYESKQDVLKLHGHAYGTQNDLGRCFGNLLRLDASTEFSFVTEHLESQE